MCALKTVDRDFRRPAAALWGGNAILDALAEPSAELVRRHGCYVRLALRAPIYQPEQSIEHVYFPIDCVLSLVTNLEDGSQIESGTIGREGTSGLPLLMGAQTSANESYCQVRGSAIKLPTSAFRELSKSDLGCREHLRNYLQAYVNMLGQLAACNSLHRIYERCARWLLQAHDRVGDEQIPITHEFLAMMLGSGRSGVTIALATLQQAGFIRYAHGVIIILDRSRLEGAACECYEVIRGYFAS